LFRSLNLKFAELADFVSSKQFGAKRGHGSGKYASTTGWLPYSAISRLALLSPHSGEVAFDD
jgi:hypothetical protein